MIAKRQPYKIINYPKRRNLSKIIPHPKHQLKEDEELAATFLTIINGNVRFLPEQNIPGIKNPDCEWNGSIWEIKTLHGNSRINTESVLRHASKQSKNIVINAVITCRDINRIAIDILHCLSTDTKTSDINQIIILGKNEYSIIRRSMVQ